jgi:hypothetical protein
MTHERSRLVPRYFFAADIELIDVRSRVTIEGRTVDMSLFGCRAVLSKPFLPGTNLEITLSCCGANVNAFGRVVYTNPGTGMGIAFTDVEQKSDRTLSGWIAELAMRHLSHKEPAMGSDGSSAKSWPNLCGT